MVKEISKDKKMDFNIKNYHAYLASLLQLLHVIREMSMCSDSINRKNAKILSQNVFSREIAKILKIGFIHYLPMNHDENFTQNLVETTMVFFDMLEEFS